MLMSAGLGTRLSPFTRDVPKALVPLLGVPIAQFAVDQLDAAQVSKVVVNLHHLAPLARSGFGSLDRQGLEMRFSDEQTELLGSAGGLAKALPELGEWPFFVLNADVIQDVDLQALSQEHQRLSASAGAKLTLALTRSCEGSEAYREIYVDGGGRITGYGSKKQNSLFYTGVAVVDPSLLRSVSPKVPSEFLQEILDPAIRRGEAFAVEHRGLWMDLGSPELWAHAHFALMRRLDDAQAPERIRARVAQTSFRVTDGFWLSRSFKSIPAGDFSEVYLGNTLYRGTSAHQCVWYGDVSCNAGISAHRSWITHGQYVQGLC